MTSGTTSSYRIKEYIRMATYGPPRNVCIARCMLDHSENLLIISGVGTIAAVATKATT